MKKVKIRMKDNDIVVNDGLTKKGEAHDVDTDTANRLVASGRADFCGVKVRALRSGLFGSVVRSPGDEFETSETDAVHLHEQGRAIVLDASTLSSPLPAPKKPPAPKPPPARGPYADEELVAVRITGRFLADNTSYEPGPKSVSLPASIANRAVAHGKAQRVVAATPADKPTPRRPTPDRDLAPLASP